MIIMNLWKTQVNELITFTDNHGNSYTLQKIKITLDSKELIEKINEIYNPIFEEKENWEKFKQKNA